jgi:hypothetical protein
MAALKGCWSPEMMLPYSPTGGGRYEDIIMAFGIGIARYSEVAQEV